MCSGEHICTDSSPSLRSFPMLPFKYFWLTMPLPHRFRDDYWMLPLPIPLFSRWSVMQCLWICPSRHRNLWWWMSNTATPQSGLPIPLLTLCSKFIESVKGRTHVVWLSTLKAIQQRPCVTASISIVMLDVETLQAALSLWMVIAPC